MSGFTQNFVQQLHSQASKSAVNYGLATAFIVQPLQISKISLQLCLYKSYILEYVLFVCFWPKISWICFRAEYSTLLKLEYQKLNV